MKVFADGNCEECELKNKCHAIVLNWCPEIHHSTRWEMNI